MESVITGLVSRFGYWGVLLLIAVENIFPPIPSEVILTFGGFLTTCTEMTPPGIILFSTLGSVAGAIVLYGVGRLLAPQRLEALLSGRAYAVTGDRIECDFTVNGQGLGETVRGAKRKLRCAVKGEYWADKLVIYKNCRPLAVLCGEQLRPKPARAYKLRVEMGWGNSEELTRWAGRITTDGRLAGANLYLRGRSLLSPTNHDGSPVEVNEIDNRVLEQDAAPPDGRRRCRDRGRAGHCGKRDGKRPYAHGVHRAAFGRRRNLAREALAFRGGKNSCRRAGQRL